MILEQIAKVKRIEVESAKHKRPVITIDPTQSVRDFAGSIRRSGSLLPKIIAEVKKASPSKGIIRNDFDHTSIARIYEEAGASAISVLTDEQFFQGHLSYLTDCRDCIRLPVLRKDFIIDTYQIEEAREAGADAVLLIAALLDTEKLCFFREQAETLGMSALVEVHDEHELDSALQSGAVIIGINNRNLHTFEVDINTTIRLVPRIPHNKIIVSESGITTTEDFRLLSGTGIDAVLIGETFMREPNPGDKLREFLTE